MKQPNLGITLLLFLAAVGNADFCRASAGTRQHQILFRAGVVEQIAPDRRTVTIHHQNIPGYMTEMTMDFNVKNTNELNGISPTQQSPLRSSWMKMTNGSRTFIVSDRPPKQ